MPDPRCYCYLRQRGAPAVLNAVGDYSVTPAVFELVNDREGPIALYRMKVFIEDSGGLNADEYGSGPELTNGIQFQKLDANDVVLSDLLDGVPLTQNQQWAANGDGLSLQDFGSGTNGITLDWLFPLDGLVQFLDPGEKLALTFNDDLSFLVSHQFRVRGFWPKDIPEEQARILRDTGLRFNG